MNPEPDSSGGRAPASRFEPSRKIRLAWWFGVYFAAQVPLMPPSQWIQAIRFLPLYPTGFGYAWLKNSSDLTLRMGPLFLLCLAIPYLVYLLHLGLVLLLPGKRAFMMLMAILIVVVTLNTVSCSDVLHSLAQVN